MPLKPHEVETVLAKLYEKVFRIGMTTGNAHVALQTVRVIRAINKLREETYLLAVRMSEEKETHG